jgi:hypothetical protein
MCDKCVTDSRLSEIRKGRAAADDILERYFRFNIHKAYDLGSPGGFDRAVVDLADKLRAKVGSSDDEAVRAAISVLDVDWKSTSAAERRNLIAQSLVAAGRKTAIVPQQIQVVFDGAADEVVQAARSAARRKHKLGISADLNALDKRIINYLRSSQATFVRDEYGRRHEVFSRKARDIVARGLESGLGRDDIARDLETAARATLAAKGSFYWDVVAGSFISNGRSFSNLSAFAEAGIEHYTIEAVLDEVTTDICRFLHGKTFAVSQGVKQFEEVEADPDNIKNLSPWVRSARDAEGRQTLFVERNGERHAVAEVTRSGFGTTDSRGEFSRTLSTDELSNLGISYPPFHGLCRSDLAIA